jgi:hypothetical protein
MNETSFSEKKTLKRFNLEVEKDEEIILYYRNMLTQLLYLGNIKWNGKINKIEDWGVMINVLYNNENYTSVYVRNNFRGKEYLPNFIKENQKLKWICSKNCEIEDFFKHMKVEYKILSQPTWLEYQKIEKYYGDVIANRSGIHYINHIDEGLYILKKINASIEAQKAFCIHPLIQLDEDLEIFWKNEILKEYDTKVLLLAFEYRNIANAYLSNKESTENFKLSPIKDVNDMLIADKIQNRKDFELNLKGKVKNSDRLVEYFHQWLKKLGVSEEFFQETVKEILSITGNTKY